jgi:hypothetical protein
MRSCANPMRMLSVLDASGLETSKGLNPMRVLALKAVPSPNAVTAQSRARTPRPISARGGDNLSVLARSLLIVNQSVNAVFLRFVHAFSHPISLLSIPCIVDIHRSLYTPVVVIEGSLVIILDSLFSR